MKPHIVIPLVLALGFAVAALAEERAAKPAPQAPTQPTAPLGRWITESGNLEVSIGPCLGSGTLLCGQVVRVIANRSMSSPGSEMTTSDARPALGMTLLRELRLADAGGASYRGEIYNRENGKTYSVKITPAEPDQLLVHAYIGLPLFGKTQVWRRPAPEHGGGE